MLTLDDVQRAAQRLDGIAVRTPVLTSRQLDERVGAEVYLKAECLQRTGSFKFRGAYNAVSALVARGETLGVLTYSSGNHGQALAMAARLHRLPAVVVMPHDAPELKVAATAGYGADVVRYDRYQEGREAIGARIASDRGLNVIPPFDDHEVMAGQGTVGLELLAEVGPLDSLAVCVGGGGLISGCATVAKALGADGASRVIGVEPAAGDDVARSFEEGRVVTIDVPDTIADGQQTTAPSERTLAVIRERVDRFALVSDDDIVEAMRFAFERLKIVLEPSGASALAAVMGGGLDLEGQRVGVTLSGGNVDATRFARLVAPE